ncbi:12057_t:CDS:1, partial [Funneliformis geosporum]
DKRYAKLEELVKVPSEVREQAECLQREVKQLYKEIKTIEYNIVLKKAETKVYVWFERNNEIVEKQYIYELEKTQDDAVRMMWNDIDKKKLEGEKKFKTSRELMKSGARKIRESIKKEIAEIDLMIQSQNQLYSFYEQQSMILW